LHQAKIGARRAWIGDLLVALVLLVPCCLFAETTPSLTRIALFEPAGQKADATLVAVLSTVAESVELSLDVLQRYEVRRVASADPARDLERVRAYCQENRIDQAILGSGSARLGGGYLFRLVVYDRRTDSITLTREGSSSGVLDMFDTTDALVASLLDALSGTHLLFGSLTVETGPAGAVVSLNGREVGTAPISLRGLPVGTVQLSARSEGHEETRTTVTIADGETTDVPLKLARSMGTLAIGMPKDAVVAISSTEMGEKVISGPGTTEMPTGEYGVQASCPGLPAVSARLTINRAASTRWLPWTKAFLDVQSDPPGATILMDGEERGAAPLVVEVEPGTPHRVELRKDKYETFRTDVTPAAGDKASLAPRLIPLPGSIRVETSIAGVNVRLDNDRSAETPFLFDNVQPGEHVLQIANVRVGRLMYTVGDPIHIDVSPGEAALVSRTFAEGKVQITIKDAPAGSSIEINGKSVDSGKALTTGIEVPAGVIDISVQAPDLQKWTGTTFVGPGIVTQRSIYTLTWVLPHRTITIDGKTDDWAGLLPVWDSALNYNTWQDQPGTQIARGFACRDERFVYFRYDFSDGSPRAQLSKLFREVLAYCTILYTKHDRDELHMNINFTRTILGGMATSTDLGAWNPSKKVWTGLGNDKLSYRIGDGTLEIAVALDVIKPYVGGDTAEATFSVANAEHTGNWLNHNGTDSRILDFGF
jgi:hypothetical protein